MPSLSYFLSYNRSDAEFALHLATDLKKEGVNIWIDQLDIPPGDRWDATVEAALQKADGVIVILTPNAVGSNNVLDEISLALDEKKRVIPILAAECGVPLRIRRLQRIDFTKDYAKGFRALQASLNTGNSQKTDPDNADQSRRDPRGPKTSGALFTKKNIILFISIAAVAILATLLITGNMPGLGSKKNITSVDTGQKEGPDTVAGVNTNDSGSLPKIDSPQGTTESSETSVNQGKVYFESGKKDFVLKRYPEAILDFTGAIKNNYNVAEALHYRGNCYRALNNLPLACEDYKKSGELGNRNGSSSHKTFCDTLRTASVIMNNVGITNVTINDHRVNKTYCAYSLNGANIYLNSILRVDYEVIVAKRIIKQSSSDRSTGFKVKYEQSACSKTIYITIISKKTDTPQRAQKNVPSKPPVNVPVFRSPTS